MQPEFETNHKIVPRQVIPEQKIAVQNLTSVVTITVIVLLTANILLSLLIAGPLQQILSSVKHLQIIAHVMLI